MKLAILNTSIVTADGAFERHSLTLDQAKQFVGEALATDGIDSAVGHAATAEILSKLLEVPIPANRQQFAQLEGQAAIVFQLNGRIPEGAVLGIDEIEAIGYSFKLLVRLPDATLQPANLRDLFLL